MWNRVFNYQDSKDFVSIGYDSNYIPDAVVKGTCHAGIETITGSLDVASNLIHIPEKGLGVILNSNISSAADEQFDAMYYDKHENSYT